MDKCNSKEILKNNNIKSTKARIKITESIISLNKPFSVSELFANNLQQTGAELTTVYRFILLLLEKEIIREIGNYNGTQYYELACKHNPLHPHFFCNKCNSIQCLSQLSTDDYIKLSHYSSNNLIKEIKIIMGGLCENCKDNN